MANKLPPNPVGVPPGSSYWNDWYEKLRTLVDEVTASTGSGDLVRENGATITAPDLNGPITIGGTAAITATVLLAALSGVGTMGQADFQDGILIGYIAPT
jgi:hypothetical protein